MTETIADFQLPIANWRGVNEPGVLKIGIWQSEIGNELHRVTCALGVQFS